jgi:hypothetical protein
LGELTTLVAERGTTPLGFGLYEEFIGDEDSGVDLLFGEGKGE